MGPSKLREAVYRKEDKQDGIRGRIGKWLLKQSLRILSVKELLGFHWRPNGYKSNKENKYHVVISEKPVQYWKGTNEANTVYAVKHEEDGILGLFWMWRDARKAASTLSQEFDDYQYQEHVLNEDKNRIEIAEDSIDELEKNLSVEKIPLYREFDFDEWPNESIVINKDNVRTADEVVDDVNQETNKPKYENMDEDIGINQT